VSAAELVERWAAAWSGRDGAAFAPLCRPEVTYEDPVVAAPLSGAGAIGEHAARLWSAFPDVRMEPSGPLPVDGAFLAAPVRLLGTNRGDLGELPPTGRFVAVHAVCFCETERERLLRVRVFLDLVDAGRQLGLMPARGGLGERALLLLRGFGLRSRREER
jgi:predicted ester cyclase